MYLSITTFPYLTKTNLTVLPFEDEVLPIGYGEEYLLPTLVSLIIAVKPVRAETTTMIPALPYSKLVEKHILECIQGGIGIRQMIASMQHLQDAPKSLSTMYKIYGSFIEMERAKINGAVGKKVIDQALDGDFKSQELFLRSKGGWSPTQTNIEVEQETDPELDESATDTLMSLLGYNTDATEEETTCSCEEDNCRCS